MARQVGASLRNRKASKIKLTLAVLLILAAVVGWLIFLGWAISAVIAWFGPKLAVWQGVVIAMLIHLLFGGNNVSRS